MAGLEIENLAVAPAEGAGGAEYIAAFIPANGQQLIGTPDGLLALWNGQDMYSLGAVSVNGPIHCLSAAPDGSVYGVAGDEMDIALLFRWDSRRGLRFLGNIGQGYGETIDDVFYCTYVTTCAVSPDGKYLAVGATERLGTVVLYRLPADEL